MRLWAHIYLGLSNGNQLEGTFKRLTESDQEMLVAKAESMGRNDNRTCYR